MATCTAEASARPTRSRMASSCASDRASGPSRKSRSRGRSLSGQRWMPPPLACLGKMALSVQTCSERRRFLVINPLARVFAQCCALPSQNRRRSEQVWTERAILPKQAKGGGIHRWPESERPRERLFREGPEALSDAQLLAILLRVGRAEASAVQVAMDLLHHLDGLQGIANRGLGELCGVRGVGLAKAAQLKAALELGKRALTTPLSTGTRRSEEHTSELQSQS